MVNSYFDVVYLTLLVLGTAFMMILSFINLKEQQKKHMEIILGPFSDYKELDLLRMNYALMNDPEINYRLKSEHTINMIPFLFKQPKYMKKIDKSDIGRKVKVNYKNLKYLQENVIDCTDLIRHEIQDLHAEYRELLQKSDQEIICMMTLDALSK
jgi:hypothetical protein